MADESRPEVSKQIRRPPESVRSEQSLLGALLLDARALDSITDVVKAEDFYRNDHRLIFEHIQKLVGQNKPVDVITLSEELKNCNLEEVTGGLSYLNELAVNATSTANIRRYAQIVREKSVLRQMIEIGDRMITNAVNPEGRELDELLSEAERDVLGINEQNSQGKRGFRSFNTLMTEVTSRLVELYQNTGQDVTGVKTHYPNMDYVLAGLQKGDLIIVAGRPSMGKTTLAINIAENIAFRSDLPVAIFSMEMGAEQIAQRVICSQARIDAQEMRKGKLDDAQWQKFGQVVQALEKKSFWVDDTPSLRINDLASRARRLVTQTGPLALIVVDYIQLMQGRSSAENRSTELSEISRGLKALAKELDCPVICLSQLNRSVDSRPDKRPMMSDLRESGAIEQDADVIMFIYRDWVYNKEADPSQAEVIVAKQRNGPIGTLRFVFKGGLTRFESFEGDRGYHVDIAESTVGEN